MKDFEFNGVVLEGDLMDADFMEKYEAAMKKMHTTAERLKADPTMKSAAEHYRAQCRVVNDCIDEIFGGGSAEKLFHGKNNVREHIECTEALLSWQTSEMKMLNDRSNKYTQRQNAAIGRVQGQPAMIVPHGKGKRKKNHKKRP